MTKTIIQRANPEYFVARYYAEDDGVITDDSGRIVGVERADGTREMYPPPYLFDEVDDRCDR